MLKATFWYCTGSRYAKRMGNIFLLMVLKKTFNYIIVQQGTSQVLALLPITALILYQPNQRQEHYWKFWRRMAAAAFPWIICDDLPFCEQQPVARRYFHIDLSKPATELVYGNAARKVYCERKVQGWGLYNIWDTAWNHMHYCSRNLRPANTGVYTLFWLRLHRTMIVVKWYMCD